MGIVEQYFSQLNTMKQRFRRSVVFLSVLSLLVIVTVSWNLRQTGIAIANDACCGYQEHQHTEECPAEKVLICGFTSEAPSEVPSEETTEAVIETFTEMTAETAEEESSEVPAEALAETSAEAETEAPTESIVEMVANAAADLISEIIPEAQAADIPEEYLEEAGDTEHIHTDECYETIWLCEFEEHIHTLACYSDLTADVEDWNIWEASIPELTGSISEDIVLVAQSQLGIGESDLNFQIAEDGETRNGITRYGQWYGNPYGPWSNMFTSFCLRFAGLSSVPVNSGAEKMQMEWESLNLYRHAGGYEPMSGDIIFLDKNQNGTPESTGVVVRYFDFILTVIEGDVNNAVVQTEYRIDDSVITGYGITNAANRLMMFASGERASAITIGTTVNYTNTAETFILYAIDGGVSYAIDGNGNAVPIEVSDGNIISDVADPAMLYWVFSGSKNTYSIKNAATGKYLYPRNGGLLSDTSQNLTLSGSTGATIRGGSRNNYFYVQYSESQFRAASSGSTIYFGRAPKQVTLWLDGTNGNLISYRGSENKAETAYAGIPMQLPSEWKSPTKYQYKLAGWVDISTGQYYAPGDTITVTKDTVLYADWVAATYDIGQFNSNVVNTVSTNDFVTTRLFDYSALINIYSSKLNSTVSASGHSETWTLATTGNAATGQTTLNFSFVEEYYNEDGYNDAGHLAVLLNRGEQGKDINVWTGGTAVRSGIITVGGFEDKDITHPLVDLLFGSKAAAGKHYLGQGDHLFQLNTDPRSAYYGYYYYDSRLNAASYNQSDQRFYVYDYLEASSDSEGNGEYSDFLPLNSPYANTVGTVSPQTWSGAPAEYNGRRYYEYESKYTANNGMTRVNWFFGMRTDIRFGLPDEPGELLEGGGYGNKDVYGKDMHFKFTGDDDVWILVDGEVVLDLGGIHLASEGDINFSTGEVRVNGVVTGNIKGSVSSGEHTLTILYLERGASMSNCAIYFNLAPRFSLTLQKEDVLTQEVLNGAIFEFFNDQACTKACELWTSQKAYKDGEPGTNVFTIENGQVYIWGLSPSRTYYIREKAPPDASGYAPAKGVIKLTLDKNGLNSYSATILPGPEGTVTHGFTVHGFRIDEENQAAYLTITNAQTWVTETTSVYVEKKWNDNKDHTYDAVTIYLQVTDPDGTVRRIRAIDLSEENDWRYEWTNLPKYIQDPVTKEESDILVQYSVAEAFESGYTYRIEDPGDSSSSTVTWDESNEFKNGDVYVLKVEGQGCLSAESASKDTLCFVEEAVAKESPLALWTATVSGELIRLQNQVGQSLLFESDGWRYRAASGENFTALSALEVPGKGLNLARVIHYEYHDEIQYICGPYGNGYMGASGTPLIFNPMVKRTSTGTTVATEGYRYQVVNTPLTSETAVKVVKRWSHPTNDTSLYEKEQVTLKLMANGVDAGRTETVNLKNNWTATFNGLPYYDEDGEVITYTVVETWSNKNWIPVYGDMVVRPGNIPTYEMSVTNVYRWEDAFELPSTGGTGYPIYILCGMPLIAAPLVYGLRMRRRYRKEARR